MASPVELMRPRRMRSDRIVSTRFSRWQFRDSLAVQPCCDQLGSTTAKHLLLFGAIGMAWLQCVRSSRVSSAVWRLDDLQRRGCGSLIAVDLVDTSQRWVDIAVDRSRPSIGWAGHRRCRVDESDARRRRGGSQDVGGPAGWRWGVGCEEQLEPRTSWACAGRLPSTHIHSVVVVRRLRLLLVREQADLASLDSPARRRQRRNKNNASKRRWFRRLVCCILLDSIRWLVFCPSRRRHVCQFVDLTSAVAAAVFGVDC